MNKSRQRRIGVGAILLTVAAWAMSPDISADAGPLSLGARGVDYVPTDGSAEYLGGVQARLRLPLFFGVEGSVDYRRETFGATTSHEWPVQLSGLLYLPKIIVVQPFLLGGGGWYHTTTTGPDGFSDTQSRFAPHAGAGVELNLTSSWFLDATYRYVWLNGLHTTNAQGVSEDVRDRGHMITVGLNYRL
jgi:opacity protein-like surface antigen